MHNRLNQKCISFLLNRKEKTSLILYNSLEDVLLNFYFFFTWNCFPMSDKNKMQAVKNQNEWISSIEEAISKKNLKHYEYKHFHNIQKIGNGPFGKVYRANRK